MIYAKFVDSVDSTGARFTGIQLAPYASDPSFTAYDVPDTSWFVLGANNVIGTRDPATVVPPQPTIQQIIVSLEAAVQTYIDSIAQKKGYDNGVSCASYSTSTNVTFAADAKTFIAWRDSVWTTCQTIENTDLTAVPPTVPTSTAVIAALPVAPW